MNTKKLRAAAAVCLIFTSLWLVFMILYTVNTGVIDTFEEAIASVIELEILFYLSYTNAVFVTVTTSIFFVYLYHYCKPFNAEWSLVGLIFVPVYSLLNLVVYVSQITVIPRLTALMSDTQYSQAYTVIAGQFVQGWSGSVLSVLNQLAYAVLGIPSIVFGVLLIKHKQISALAGWLLVLNGFSCIVGLLGTAADYQALANGSTVGGALFLFSLAAIVVSIRFIHGREMNNKVGFSE